ncbi:YqzL family protein [Anaerobacillus sp. CMMVII]|nr:YqzL family protein [Anaerobacillus sp. CMMVII]MCT8139689.1 YqzL family protein [Anaerobacillus sp. CMMVII]
MLDFSWKVFSMTGSVDTYLILKEIERDTTQSTEEFGEKLDEIDTPTN